MDSLESKRKFIIWAILLIGFLVRIYRIDWGLPAEYWADEDVILSYSAYIGLTKSLNPYTFGYSSLIFYVGTLIGFVDWIILNLAGANVDWDFLWSSYFADYTIVVLSARIFLALVGVLTVYLTYRIGEKVSEKVGLISALLVALSPLAIVETRRYGGDGLMGLFTTLSLLFTTKFINSNKFKDAILSSVFAGFALGTKYYGGAVIISLWVAMLIKQKSLIKTLKSRNFWVSIVVLLGSFLLSSPYILVHPKLFIKFFGHNILHAVGGHLGFEHSPPAYWTGLTHIAYSISLVGLLIAIGVIVYHLTKPHPKITPIAAFPLLFYILTAFWKTSFARYFYVVTPPMAILAACGLNYLWNKAKFLSVVLVIASVAQLVIWDYAILRYISLPSSEEIVKKWITEHIPPDEKIATISPKSPFAPTKEYLLQRLRNSRTAAEVDTLKYKSLLRFSCQNPQRDMLFISPYHTRKRQYTLFTRIKNKAKHILKIKTTPNQSPAANVEELIKNYGANYFLAQSLYYLRHLAAPDYYPNYVKFYKKLFKQKPLFETGNEYITARELPPLKVMLKAKVAGQKYKIFKLE